MDRWQLWRRIWFRMQNKNHSRRQYAVRTRSDPEGQRSQQPPPRYMLGPQHFLFVSRLAAGLSQRPKVLLDVDCSNLLTGGSNEYENFSSSCWLEDHLHHFGQPSPSHITAPGTPPPVSSSYEFHGSTDFEALSSEDLSDSYEDYSADSAEEPDEDSPRSSSGGMNHGGVSNGNVINLHRYPYVDENEAQAPVPPPYEDEPPPTYEEAIADSSFWDHEEEDFLW